MIVFIHAIFLIFSIRVQVINSEFQSHMIPSISQEYLNFTLPPMPHPTDININPNTLRKATINYGSLTYETKRKIINNECLNIVVIGGSVSCFHFAQRDARWHDDFPWFDKDGYAEKFENMLNEHMPCNRTKMSSFWKPNKHMVANHCQAATPTNVFVQKYLESKSGAWDAGGFGLNMKEVDLIIVETAMNDINEGAESGRKEFTDPTIYIKKQTELLILLFQNISTHPSMIYLGASTRFQQLHLDQNPIYGCELKNRWGDAVYIHSELTKYYDIPHVSVIDGMCPFYNEKARRWLEWYFNADVHGHPTKSGHTLIASFVASLFFQHVYDLKYPVYGGDAEDLTSSKWQVPLKAPLPPLYSTPIEVISYLYSYPLKLDLVRKDVQYIVPESVTGFTIYEDVPGKPGYIATTVGSTFGILVPGVYIGNHLKMGQVTIVSMKSYEHMGVLLVTFSIKNTVTNTVISTVDKRIDCLWQSKVSEQTIDTMSLTLPSGEKKLDPKEYSVELKAVVVAATPTARADNKVKLISVSFS